MYQLTGTVNQVKRISDNTFIGLPPSGVAGHDYAAWLAAGNTPEPAPVDPPPTQFELDQRRYKRRAEVQAELIAWMAADNMSRVRSGVWTVADLTSLLADTHLTAANQFMTTLSYELAAQSIHASTNPLLTQDIKAAWVAKLTEHFYLVP